jgi:hypothetical protein
MGTKVSSLNIRTLRLLDEQKWESALNVPNYRANAAN